MGCANHRITLLVADLGSSLNVRWALTDRPPAYYLASAIAATGIALLAFFGSVAAGKDCRQRLYPRKHGGKSFHG
jgi:hypothetical protein